MTDDTCECGEVFDENGECPECRTPEYWRHYEAEIQKDKERRHGMADEWRAGEWVE